MKRQLHLNLFIQSRGHHEASWRHPLSSPLGLDRHPLHSGSGPPRGGRCFNSIFLGDTLALGEDMQARRRGSSRSPCWRAWR